MFHVDTETAKRPHSDIEDGELEEGEVETVPAPPEPELPGASTPEPELPGASTSKDARASECTHEVALPPGMEPLQPGDPMRELPVQDRFAALEFPFALDPFQKAALACVERGESVLVSAHTSAGKTVVAQYAVALSLKRGQRVVYTSPIKALSNQKYRELLTQFADVGLMTGDNNVNCEASCLVMTTEVLRNMLYKGHELVREVQWVIFDEVHYMRDKERGVVWEECIILLPHAVRFIFLSATIPNAPQFAAWVAAVHKQPCHVIGTHSRPTPLQHWLFPAGGGGLHLVLDEAQSRVPKSAGSVAPHKSSFAVALLARPLRQVPSCPRRREASRRGILSAPSQSSTLPPLPRSLLARHRLVP